MFKLQFFLSNSLLIKCIFILLMIVVASAKKIKLKCVLIFTKSLIKCMSEKEAGLE